MERKIALAVPIFELFRARFRVAMATFKAEMVSSRPVGCWGSVAMVETVGSCKRAVRYEERLGGSRTPLTEMSVQFITARLVRVDQKRSVFATAVIGETNRRFQRVSSIIAEW